MRKLWTLLVALAALTATPRAALGSEPEAAATGAALPLFAAADLDGGQFRLGDHLGRDVVLLSFWATYCEPCKAEMPVLQRLHDAHAAAGLKVLSIALDGPETVSGVRPHIKKNAFSFQVVVDEDSTIAQAYNPSGAAPFLILIGRDGRVAKQVEGFQPAEAPALEAAVRALLDAAPPGAGPSEVAGLSLEITESLFADWHFRLDDPQIARDEDKAHIVDLRNRLNVRLRTGAYTFGVRLDFAWFANPPANPGQPTAYGDDVRPEELFVTARLGELTLTLGDDYLSFGRGLALSLRKLDELGFATSLRGLHASWQRGPVRARLAAGLTNVVNVDLVEEKRVPDPNDLVLAARVEAQPLDALKLGAHVVDIERRHSELREAVAGALSGDDDSRPVQNQRYERTLLGGGNVELPSLFAGALSLYAELGALATTTTRETASGRKTSTHDGLAAYAQIQAFLAPVTVLAEFKRYDGYKVDSTLHPDTAQAQGVTQTFTYIAPPTLERVDQRVFNNSDVTGAHLRVDYRGADASDNLFVSGAFFVDAPGDGDRTLHVYGGLEHTGDAGNRMLVQAGYRREEAPDEDLLRLRVIHLDLDVFEVLSEHLDLQFHWSHEFRDKNVGSASLQDTYLEGTSYLSVNLPPRWSFTAQLEYLTDAATEDPVFPGVFAQYRFTADSFLRLFVGRSKGGLKCSGGVCRVFPDFEGVKLETTVRF